MRSVLFACLCLALSACATQPVPLGDTCAIGSVQLRADFPQARAENCQRLGPSSFSVTISPEATPINPSPWYAFEILATRDTDVTVMLNYAHSEHRYRPKRETGGGWTVLPDGAVVTREDGSQAEISFAMTAGRSKIAGQEWLPPAERQAWVEDFANRSGLTLTEIGKTVEGRLVSALSDGNDTRGAPLVIILGGQHPPEVPGVLGIRAFLETLFLDDERAAELLGTYKVLIVPEMNLDGVERGYWRLNVGLVDLNRDWGPFTQPETRAVRDEISRLVAEGYRPVLMLDFHATRRDVFYTAPDGSGLSPPNFARHWLTAIDASWQGDMPGRSSSHNPDLPTSRSWFIEAFDAPAITVEFGDETPRDDIDGLAKTYAETLLDALTRASVEENAP